MSDDLAPDRLMAAMPGRPVRSYPALLSTEADALGWARTGAPQGAVVVADYQASPRGRGGIPWTVAPGRDLAFSVVLRPNLAIEREGWLYTVLTTALTDVVGGDASIAWPDEVRRDAERLGAVAAHVELGPRSVAWAVANVVLHDAPSPRASTLARLVTAIEARCAGPADEVLEDHRQRCRTLGRRVSAALLPMGPNARRVAGSAATTLRDGALVIATEEGPRVAVPPQALWLLEDA